MPIGFWKKRQGVVFHRNHHHRVHRLRGADTKSFRGRGAAHLPRPEYRLVQGALGRSLRFHVGPDLAVSGEDIGVPQRGRLGAVVVGGMGGGLSMVFTSAIWSAEVVISFLLSSSPGLQMGSWWSERSLSECDLQSLLCRCLLWRTHIGNDLL